jgi:endonuclease/exonuclease/phosphatase family metal-dependent hydrolase
MNCNILSWNVRGLNCPDKRLTVRNLLRQWRVDIVCLQETKLDFISRRDVSSLMGLPLCRLVLCGGLRGCWGHFGDVG